MSQAYCRVGSGFTQQQRRIHDGETGQSQAITTAISINNSAMRQRRNCPCTSAESLQFHWGFVSLVYQHPAKVRHYSEKQTEDSTYYPPFLPN